MPTMTATNTPHAAAIATSESRRRTADDGAPAEPLPVCRVPSVIGRASSVIRHPSQRPVQHVGAELDDGDHVEQKHQRAERERDGDRTMTATPLLLLGEDDAVFAVVVVH